MPAYAVFIRECTKDADAMATYSQMARAASEGRSMVPLAAYGHSEVLEGPSMEGAVIVEFPTMEDAKAWYDSPEYSAAREHRFKGAEYRAFIVEGLTRA